MFFLPDSFDRRAGVDLRQGNGFLGRFYRFISWGEKKLIFLAAGFESLP